MTDALALQHNKKEEKIHAVYKTYTIALHITGKREKKL